ncbi:MAG: DUF5397 family protein [bacterium]|nr:DUF5397 family protein [bacterium]
MEINTQTHAIPQSMIGTVHRFGEKGVLYEVVRPADESSVVIRVLDTGEETAYPIAHVKQDPSE